jgi:hypothetical protein
LQRARSLDHKVWLFAMWSHQAMDKQRNIFLIKLERFGLKALQCSFRRYAWLRRHQPPSDASTKRSIHVTHMSPNKCKQKINNVAVYFGSKYACHGYHISVPPQRLQCIAAGPHATVCSFLSASPQLTVCPVTSRRQFFSC